MSKIIKLDNSCAVLALHYVSGLNEGTVTRVCRFHDFDPSFGMSDGDWIDAAKDLGISVRMIFDGRSRLKKFISEHKTGLFLVRTHDHIFCLDNGLIVDPAAEASDHYPGLGRIVRWAWKVTKTQ